VATDGETVAVNVTLAPKLIWVAEGLIAVVVGSSVVTHAVKKALTSSDPRPVTWLYVRVPATVNPICPLDGHCSDVGSKLGVLAVHDTTLFDTPLVTLLGPDPTTLNSVAEEENTL
jgi:hypothetical protein